MAIISRSNASRAENVMDGSAAASFSADLAAAGSRTRLTSFPPCGATKDIEILLRLDKRQG